MDKYYFFEWYWEWKKEKCDEGRLAKFIYTTEYKLNETEMLEWIERGEEYEKRMHGEALHRMEKYLDPDTAFYFSLHGSTIHTPLFNLFFLFFFFSLPHNFFLRTTETHTPEPSISLFLAEGSTAKYD